jgi:hypothetical protein
MYCPLQSGCDTARADIPLVKDESLHARFSQVNRRQRPGCSTTNDDRVTGNIALQGRVIWRQAVVYRSKGMT